MLSHIPIDRTELAALSARGARPSLEASGGWLQQWARVLRWHERVLKESERNAEAFPEELDDLLAFFVSCHHLEEWAKAGFPDATADQVSILVQASEPLAACRDIADRAKHLFLTRPHEDAGWQWIREFSYTTPGRPERWLVFHAERVYSMNDLVEQCVAEWRRILAELRLIER